MVDATVVSSDARRDASSERSGPVAALALPDDANAGNALRAARLDAQLRKTADAPPTKPSLDETAGSPTSRTPAKARSQFDLFAAWSDDD